MLNERTAQSLSYVWQPQYFTPSIAKLVKKNNLQIILDVSHLSIDQLSHNIQDLNGTELKISLDHFFSPVIISLLKDIQTKTIWVEYFQQLPPYNPETFLQQISVHNERHCNIITGDLNLINTCFTHPSQVSGLAIKGSESSGFVSSETILALISHLETLAIKHQKTPDIHVWGGITTPEGACACLASGVSQVIFESLHWLTDNILGQDSSIAKRISNLRIDHTSTVDLKANLQLRVFDKGNSLAVKATKQLAQETDNSSPESVEKLAAFIASKTILPLQADYDEKQLIPIGPEAAFATSFTKRFGQDTTTALSQFANETARLLTHAQQAIPKMLNGDITKLLGIQYPFIQGAMACISDVPEFALSIAQAGGLPTIAMGIKSIKEIEKDLSSLSHVLQGYQYAINVITLPENPYRSEQIAWIEENKPPFVVISAGAPNHAVKLQEKGIPVIYVTSDIDLLQLAWNNNISIVICEGQEAGGHVGEHSTLTLAQSILVARRQPTETTRKQFLILAGGISNTNSLGRAALLGADGIQMGTRYLSSREVVSSGALSQLYQQTLLQSSFGDTTLTGESVGLRVRSIVTPKTEKIRLLENKLHQQTNNETAIRHQLEETSIGSLMIAARNHHPQSGEALSEDTCYREGQFMSGVIAGDLHETLTVAEIHNDIAKTTFKAILKTPPQQRIPQNRISPRERISITGMAMVNSLGNSPEEIWQACLAMESGISEIPTDKWNHNDIFEVNSNARGKTYCKVGAFVSLDITRKELGIPPHDFRTMTASTKLTLWLAHKAIHESQLLNSDIPRHRIGVIVSQNAGEMGSTTADLSIFAKAKEIANSIRQSYDLPSDQSESLEQAIKSGHLAIDDTTLLGRLNCAAAGFICNKYGFTGPSYAVTSACASSLTALYNGVQLIQNGVLDAVIIGGGEELLIKASFIEFSALGALAGKGYDNKNPAAFSRPFDAERSGMVLGEGGGLIVIERETIARKRNAPIVAHITGVGASNNHQGMVESIAGTQKIAINTSFQEAGYGPDQIDMVECHATATHMGDREEVNALKSIFPPDSSVVLTSFKSQIGHTLGASGISSLIRGVCAMRDGIYPPTLNYNNPDPDIGLEEAGFRVCNTPEQWTEHANRPRRFEVNAFGFGGANYVIQIEGERQDKKITNNEGKTPILQSHQQISTPSQPSIGVSFFKTQLNSQSLRIGATRQIDTTSAFEKQIFPYQKNLANLPIIQSKELAKLGITVEKDTEKNPSLAIIFSGQGSHYPTMGQSLYHTFPVIRHWMDTLAQLADFDILHLLFQGDERKLQRTEYQQPALFLFEYALFKQLDVFGLQPTAMAGHSMGELTALCVAGCFSYNNAFKLITKRAQCMEKASRMVADPGAMLAINVPAEYLETAINNNANLFITNFNSPQQTVVGGSCQEVERLKKQLDKDKHWNVLLPVPMAFHSPTMKIVREELGQFLATMDVYTPQIPVLSNATCQPYPNDPSEIKKTILSHLESPVHWQSNVLSLIKDFGCHQFLEIGPQDTLCSLARECDPNIHCINSCLPKDEVMAFRESAAALYVRGCITPDDITTISFSQSLFNNNDQVSKEAIASIIQQEIYSYALHGTEKYLKPAIIRAIQKQVDPHFNEQSLATYIPNNSTPEPLLNVTTDSRISAPILEDNTIVEQVIHIIMNATGYDRDEIHAEMDLRNDLAIKSSRIPIIVDDAEKTFNITTSLEDFLTVRTIQDLANRIIELMDDDVSHPSTISPAIEKPVTNIAESGNAEAMSRKAVIFEQVVQIIMDTTGYERDEIEGEMDIRNDLAIKSSRIPIIVDSAEKTFNITSSLEDFLTVRTIQDLVDRIVELMENGDVPGTAANVSIANTIVPPAQDSLPIVSSPEFGINRLIYHTEEIIPQDESFLQIDTDSRILILTLTDCNYTKELNDSFKELYNAKTISLQVEENQQQKDGFINLFNPDETIRIIKNISEEGPLTGIIFISDIKTETQLSPKEINLLLAGFFVIFQHFLRSVKRNFCFHFHVNDTKCQNDSMLHQAILGLHLTASKEYKTLCLRSLTTLANSSLPSLLPIAFNLSNPLIELLVDGQQLYSSKIINSPLSVREQPLLTLSDTDVIVISGGGRGITSYLSRALASFGCKLILLGRTPLNASINLKDLPESADKEQQFITDYLQQEHANLSPREFESKKEAVQNILQIQKTLTELEALGANAHYHTCDVTDPTEVTKTINTIYKQHGRIDGIIHGAGITKDSFISLITPDMFQSVMDVKLFGLTNLLQATKKTGLRFVTAFSSIAAAGGNIGQANYCMANRAMAAYCHAFKNQYPTITTKVFWLPPIEGTGMADTAEIKDILQQNMGNEIFLEVHEAAETMIRELLCGPTEDCWIVPLRVPPPTKSALIDSVNHDKHWFNLNNLPMLDAVLRLDLREKTLHATRTLSSDRDLWLADHKPSKLLRHPIMSAIMAIEAFLETCHFLFPYLHMTSLRNVQLLKMIECPPEIKTEIHFFCHAEPNSTAGQTCNVELKRRKTTNPDSAEDDMETYFSAQVLGSSTSSFSVPQQPVIQTDSIIFSQQQITELYEKYSSLTNRYQVLNTIIRYNRDEILGKMTYPEVNDFSKELPSISHYPHYLLEALMQLTLFFTNLTNNSKPKTMIPVAMSNISFSRNCRVGEELFLEGQLRSQNEDGTLWDMNGIDSDGFTIMQIHGLQMRQVG